MLFLTIGLMALIKQMDNCLLITPYSDLKLRHNLLMAKQFQPGDHDVEFRMKLLSLISTLNQIWP